MSVLSVDLAARYSGAMLMSAEGRILREADSWAMAQDVFLDWVVFPWTENWALGVNPKPDVLIVEDLPAGVPFMKNTKNVCRLQGRIIEKMIQLDAIQDLLFIPPAVWIRSFGIKTVKDSAKLIQPKAEELGYTPPYDFNDFHGKDRQTARKSNSDYCAAFLIGTWANKYYTEHGTYDAPTTSRYEHG